MTPDRIVVVHSAEQMRAAVRVACRRGVALTIRSAPHAAASLGPDLFRAMVARAAPDDPSIPIRFVLDCGGDPGFALAAFRAGVRRIRVDLPDPVLAKVTEIGRDLGACIDADGADGPTLDLADRTDADAACEAWLDEEQNAPESSIGEASRTQNWALT